MPDSKLSAYANMSVADIKNRAKETVLKQATKASAASLLHVARDQILKAKDCESAGDLPAALEGYIKAATLLKMTMDSAEYKKDGARGSLRKEMSEFITGTARDLSTRTNSVEDRLRSIEASQQSSTAESSDKSINKSFGGSIADRKRALQESGLAISPPNRLSREIPSLPSAPLSPTRPSTNAAQPTPSSVLASTATPPPSSSASQSAHTFVPASSFGPPSPASSPSSSPTQNTHFDISGFAHNFPSIDELDENPSFSLPSVPTGVSTVSSKPSLKDIRNGDVPQSPSTNFRNFALHIERPSSTPITPTTNNVFNSRPTSPTRANAPLKPSGLASSTTSPSTNAVPPQPAVVPIKPPIPKTNIAYPKDLRAYMRDYTVLVIDVRNRADFDRGHIKAQAIVCIEPTVLVRDGLTADKLEESMVIAPGAEANLFANRDKFDIVAVCDQDSKVFGESNTPLSTLLRLISERAFKKILKRMPMLVVGGVEAWKKEFGEGEIIRGASADGFILSPTSTSPPTSNGISNAQQQEAMDRLSPSGIPLSPKPMPSPKNPFVMNGLAGAMSPPLGTPSEGIATPSMNPFRRSPNVSVNGFSGGGEHRPSISLDQSPSHSRAPAEINYSENSIQESSLQRRSAMMRPSISQNGSTTTPPTLTNGSFSPISYPQFPPRRISPTTSGSPSSSVNGINTAPQHPSQSQATAPPSSTSPFISPPDIASPPPASLNPASFSTRRRNDYIDQTHEALTGFNRDHPVHAHAVAGARIDYPDLMPRPPPMAAASALERQDQRPRVPPPPPAGSSVLTSTGAGATNGAMVVNGAAGLKPPRINSDYPVTYWADVQVGLSGLKNLGNTCYMNAPIQCLSATVPFARFFTDARWRNAINLVNPLGSKGRLTHAFAKLLHEMWGQDLPYLTPHEFRKSICQLRSQYDNSEQHDSQEFLSFLMDGIHEDLNRVMVKPKWAPTPEQEAELERLPPQIAGEREWRAWKERNDSLVVDYFQGQFRNRLECLTCHQTSTTYNVFSILQLPIPHGRNGKVPIDKCLQAFFNEEILEKDDAWDCPKCKTKRRASKKLSLARLPPVLLIHLKRFEANGRFSDKVDTFVEFPMKSLDLTNYMPSPLPPGADKSELNGGLPMSVDDPRTQLPPYRYDLYGVTNHFGNLTSGHYTAFVQSRGGWMYCDDSSVKAVDAKQVVIYTVLL
ncbi:hypothetical protein D9756_002213 [Leucocoprinus leucothites]|uniref:ubiquitinyl hydrolase 1 n=1 Tax=Leucocoprinus leucothites TaxID=201217 RepID=A0A8H5LLN1_9AGAR|nr:hypothetical protein D9756_002213 [Leucoagaricus leucothites]